MKRFEYKTVVIEMKGTWNPNFDLDEIHKTLNEMGQEGWELVAVEDIGYSKSFFYTFKREI